MDGYEFMEAAALIARKIVAYNKVDVKTMRIVPPDQPPKSVNWQLEVPDEGEDIMEIIKKTFDLVIPDIVHINHVNFGAFLPSPNHYPSVLGDMLCVAMGGVGFSWESSPSFTELELIMANWVAQMLHLPRDFINGAEGFKGSGCHQETESDVVYNVFSAARHRYFKEKGVLQSKERYSMWNKMVVYASEDCHIPVHTLAVMEHLTLRLIPVDSNGCIHEWTLRKTVKDDLTEGRIPLLAIATLGSFLKFGVDDLGAFFVCKEDAPLLWIHADCSFGAGAMMLPDQFPHMTRGLALVDSISATLSNFLPFAFDCTFLWLKDTASFIEVFVVDPIYLKHSMPGAVDLRHFGIPLSRRFRAFKDFITIRTYGISGLTEYVREKLKITELFARSIEKIPILKLVLHKYMIVHFADYRDTEKFNRELYTKLWNSYTNLLFSPIIVDGKFLLRFTPSSSNMTLEQVDIIIHMIKAALNWV